MITSKVALVPFGKAYINAGLLRTIMVKRSESNSSKWIITFIFGPDTGDAQNSWEFDTQQQAQDEMDAFVLKVREMIIEEDPL